MRISILHMDNHASCQSGACSCYTSLKFLIATLMSSELTHQSFEKYYQSMFQNCNKVIETKALVYTKQFLQKSSLWDQYKVSRCECES